MFNFGENRPADFTVLLNAETFRSLWRELHAENNPTATWFDDWVSRVPNIGCGCMDWVIAYVKETNPPRFHDWQAWACELHNAVNAKLGKCVLWDCTKNAPIPNPSALLATLGTQEFTNAGGTNR